MWLCAGSQRVPNTHTHAHTQPTETLVHSWCAWHAVPQPILAAAAYKQLLQRVTAHDTQEHTQTNKRPNQPSNNSKRDSCSQALRGASHLYLGRTSSSVTSTLVPLTTCSHGEPSVSFISVSSSAQWPPGDSTPQHAPSSTPSKCCGNAVMTCCTSTAICTVGHSKQATEDNWGIHRYSRRSHGRQVTSGLPVHWHLQQPTLRNRSKACTQAERCCSASGKERLRRVRARHPPPMGGCCMHDARSWWSHCRHSAAAGQVLFIAASSPKPFNTAPVSSLHHHVA